MVMLRPLKAVNALEFEKRPCFSANGNKVSGAACVSIGARPVTSNRARLHSNR